VTLLNCGGSSNNPDNRDRATKKAESKYKKGIPNTVYCKHQLIHPEGEKVYLVERTDSNGDFYVCIEGHKYRTFLRMDEDNIPVFANSIIDNYDNDLRIFKFEYDSLTSLSTEVSDLELKSAELRSRGLRLLGESSRQVDDLTSGLDCTITVYIEGEESKPYEGIRYNVNLTTGYSVDVVVVTESASWYMPQFGHVSHTEYNYFIMPNRNGYDIRLADYISPYKADKKKPERYK
jgi:hypothetical protein